ncbi:porin family protein [Rhodocytophaga aerolata]|uniref:Porin family protein n=1 Tax=Rhodocytophaga aerolata TaxID=455078 RepID=A0ABT8R3Z9_9BACT|nr:porin family protein [Rhodocytophaga aerolata]MDO1446819.1 porin family protein [Rhodocytophaga aerolata]
MKVKSLILFFCLLPSIGVFAQSSTPVNIGIKVGANYSTLIRQDRNLSADYRLGYVGGVFARFNVNNLYIQPEVVLSSKNTRIRTSATSDYSDPSNPVRTSTTVQLNSVDIPLLVGVKVIETDQFNLRLMAGPLASLVFDSRGLEGLVSSETPVKDAYNRSIWGYQAGIGADLGSITLDAVYESSFNEAYDLSRYNLGKPKNGLFMFTVGFKFL